jgi:hypothetical protein
MHKDLDANIRISPESLTALIQAEREVGKNLGFNKTIDYLKDYITVEQGVVFEGKKLVQFLETKKSEILNG